ncbi:7-cyano-7-deazaguanine synthase [Candidatus Pacearchaeota archaeon]|nr:7-cyano-7-deazaguanine synthase [Candidatus Pacearchaeota archaeon]
MKKKCIVMLSGGLDSLLAVKIVQEQCEVIAVYFKLPFCKDIEKEIKEFCKKEKIKLKIFDCTRGKLLKEYLKIIKDPKYGRGAGVNVCIDCRIFMFKTTKKFADQNKIEFIATGEVEAQRPMSQMKNSLKLIEEKSGLKNRLLRPLSEFGISGRRRHKQMALAKKFKISYPYPAGGCLLCEKELKKRFEFLFKRGLNEDEVKFVNVGRHFVINGCWVVLGKDEKENKIIEGFGQNVVVPDFPAPSALMLDKCNKKIKEKINNLIKAYSKKGSLKERKKFEKYKI